MQAPMQGLSRMRCGGEVSVTGAAQPRARGSTPRGRGQQPLMAAAGVTQQPTSGSAALEATDGSYVTFTNRTGQVLSPIAEDVYAVDRPFLPPLLLSSIDVGGRSVVLRFRNGDLWVHAPLSLDGRLAAALRALGPVKHIVTPNYEHTKFAQQWKEAYPDAKLWGCPGLQQKMPGVFDEEIGNRPDPPEWAGEVESEWLSYERNPFTNKPFFNEVVFLLKRQRILATTDLYYNYPDSRLNLGSAVWATGMHRVYRPFYRKYMIGGEPGEYEKRMRRLFEQWDWDGILPCHGDFFETGGPAELKQHLGLKGLQGL